MTARAKYLAFGVSAGWVSLATLLLAPPTAPLPLALVIAAPVGIAAGAAARLIDAFGGGTR